MTKVITYGTYDMLHFGHIRLLERAKALGDYLIVGVTADDFDRKRGKINVQQSLMERIEAVRATGLADEIIVEEYEGQKIDDIRRYHVDIFAIGSDWVGAFDYLREYCQVIYLPRTQGVSSSEIRAEQHRICLGLVGEADYLVKFIRECDFVNGVHITGVCCDETAEIARLCSCELVTTELPPLLEQVDALYITSHPTRHYEQIKLALEAGKHVLCEAPIALTEAECEELFRLAAAKNCILSEALKTAYSTAFTRLILLIKGGVIGKPIAVDAVCTSLKDLDAISPEQLDKFWNTICAWGPTAMLPIFQLFGTEWTDCRITTKLLPAPAFFDAFTKIDFTYPDTVATVKVGKGVKSESELIISGTKGYIYVPAPWWKTDYFEVRYENPADNKRFFYQLSGEGIRNEIAAFVKMIHLGRGDYYIAEDVSRAFSRILSKFYHGDYTALA